MNKIVQSLLGLFYAVCVRIEQFCNACFSNNIIALVVIHFSSATICSVQSIKSTRLCILLAYYEFFYD